MAVMSLDGLERVADVGPYEAQWQVRQRPVPARSTVLELLPQRPACGSYARGRQPPLAVAGMASHWPSAST
jgi:hypothetical protein